MTGASEAGQSNTREPLMRSRELAEWLSVSEATLSRWRREDRGPRCLWLADSSPRYQKSDVDRWLKGKAA